MKESNKRIIELLAEGKTVKEVAHDLKLNRRSLEKHIQRLRKTHNCDNTTQLVAKMLPSNLKT